MFVSTIDPILFHLGPFEVRYYGLFIVISIILGYFLIRHLAKRKEISLTDEEVLDYILWVVIGIFLGARLFYIVFYNLPFYLANPFKMIALWEGGLSFHGGLVGSIV